MFIVIIAVFKPMRAHARAASQPACPAPTTTTSNCSCIVIIVTSVNILIIGSGGREHALAWRLAQSPSRPKLFAAPGNPGIARVATCLPVADLYRHSPCCSRGHAAADLTIVGPEAPLVDGVVDRFPRRRPHDCRPRQPTPPGSKAARSTPNSSSPLMASRLRASKPSQTPSQAARRVPRFGFPVVVKTDGLAAGKGVIIAHDQAEAEAALPVPRTHCRRSKNSSSARRSASSFSAMARRFTPFAAAQDHKLPSMATRVPTPVAWAPTPTTASSLPPQHQRDPRHDHRADCRRIAFHRLPLRRPHDDRRRPSVA